MSTEILAFAPVVLPLVGSALIFCAKAFLQGAAARKMEYIGVGIGLGLPWIAIVLTFPIVLSGGSLSGVIGGWSGGIGVVFRFDGLTWLVNLLGYTIAGAAWVYSLGAGPRGPVFSAVFLIQTASLAATMMTADLFNLFVCLEVMGIASYVLVASSGKPGALLASFSYLMVSAAAMIFFLLGVYGLYRLTGSLSYAGIAAALRESGVAAGAFGLSVGTTAVISLTLIVAAVAMRVAVMPLYGWLPDAHALAPHAVSAVLSGVLIKTPLFALSRVLMIMPAGAAAGELLGYAGAATALVGVAIALAQSDAKRLLAYHSISQIGYVVSAWGAAVAVGPAGGVGIFIMAAAFLHAFYHALFKGLLFLSVGTTVDAAGERNVYRLRAAGRLLRAGGERVPITLLGFAVGALAISAIPPFNGFASKTAIGAALKGTGQYWLLFAAGIGTMASFIKLSRIYWPGGGSSRSSSSSGNLSPQSRRTFGARQVAVLMLALLCIAGGIFAPFVHEQIVLLLQSAAGSTAGSMTGQSVSGAVQEVSTAESRLHGGQLSLYDGSNLFKTALVTAGGVLLFLVAVSRRGSYLLGRLRERVEARTFSGLFIAFALGTAVLAGWLLTL